eukprot:gene6486-11940_t
MEKASHVGTLTIMNDFIKTPHQPSGQPFSKFSVAEACDRIKEEFNFLQAQNHSLKMECEKLASEKTEMQRHYVMYYEMSYGLNVEMHKQVVRRFFKGKEICPLLKTVVFFEIYEVPRGPYVFTELPERCNVQTFCLSSNDRAKKRGVMLWHDKPFQSAVGCHQLWILRQPNMEHPSLQQNGLFFTLQFFHINDRLSSRRPQALEESWCEIDIGCDQS